MIVARVNITSDQMVIIALMFFAMIKIIWLFGLPYAMTYEYLKYRKSHGWSIMPLFEFPFILLAIWGVYKTNQEGLLSPLSIALWGFGLSLLAHLHLLFIWPIIGIVCIKILKIRPPDEPEEWDRAATKQSERNTQL